MTNRDALYHAVAQVRDPLCCAFTRYVLDEAPSHFWTKPSSSGNHHPSDEHRDGGLVLHTLRVVRVGLVFRESGEGRLDGDVLLSACILHDICRYGDTELPHLWSCDDHPEMAARLIRRLGGDSGYVKAIADAVESHTGRWGERPPSNETEWAVHYADNIAAATGEISRRLGLGD